MSDIGEQPHGSTAEGATPTLSEGVARWEANMEAMVMCMLSMQCQQNDLADTICRLVPPCSKYTSFSVGTALIATPLASQRLPLPFVWCPLSRGQALPLVSTHMWTWSIAPFGVYSHVDMVHSHVDMVHSHVDMVNCSLWCPLTCGHGPLTCGHGPLACGHGQLLPLVSTRMWTWSIAPFGVHSHVDMVNCSLWCPLICGHGPLTCGHGPLTCGHGQLLPLAFTCMWTSMEYHTYEAPTPLLHPHIRGPQAASHI